MKKSFIDIWYMYVCLYVYIYIYIFLFGNTWLIAWHVSYLDYMGGPYESGSHCNQCKDLPTFSTVLFCCLHYCINVIYYVLFCLINCFQVQVQVLNIRCILFMLWWICSGWHTAVLQNKIMSLTENNGVISVISRWERITNHITSIRNITHNKPYIYFLNAIAKST